MGEVVRHIATHTAGDGYVWHYRHYPACGNRPLARVVCIHGIQSHGGWYEHSCRRLSEAGFDVCFVDRRGSGLNPLHRGDTPSYQRLLDDLVEFLTAQSAGQRMPTFLVGISWGGKLAAALPCYRPGLINGVVLLCPGFFPKLTPRSRRLSKFLRLVRRIYPRLPINVPLSDPSLFTSTPRWQEFLRHDSLALHKATARFLVASLDLDIYLRTVPAQFDVPVLLFLSGRDRIIENEPTRRFVERFAASDRCIIEYPEAHHTLEFEPEPDMFINDLIHWLSSHAKVNEQLTTNN